MVRLNSPTLDTTKLATDISTCVGNEARCLPAHTRTHLVPSSVQLMNCADFASLIILGDV